MPKVCAVHKKRFRLLEWIKQQKIDILFVQETHFTANILQQINNDFTQFNAFHSFGSTHSKGCSILINKRLEVSFIDTVTDGDCGYVFINLQMFDSIYSFFNIYAPNDKVSRNAFFNDIQNSISTLQQGILLIGGDFNDVLSDKDRLYKHNSGSRPVKHLQTLIKQNNLIDIWRLLINTKSQFTWRRKNGFEKSRIDYWLIDENIVPLIKLSDIRPALIQTTDHLAVSVKITSPLNRGPGFGK